KRKFFYAMQPKISYLPLIFLKFSVQFKDFFTSFRFLFPFLSNRGKDEKILSLREELLEETNSFRRDLAKEVYNQDMIAFEE
ncbi:hypothetical protein EPT55_10340, partial [Fusobacterium necrophorum]|uniref:hypothetical protein n=1 Tax=Fusobacterium necrophorum TaxID=859 RepID=UPI0010253464